MIIWILGGVLVLLAAAIGYFFGAIRTAVCLVGAIVAASFATTVGVWVGGVVPMIGYTNPTCAVLPSAARGLPGRFDRLFGLAFKNHHWVQRHYRNNTDDYTFARWGAGPTGDPGWLWEGFSARSGWS